MKQTHKSTKRGFTLLEVLLVIAAIGILASIVLVAINPNRQINQARQAAISSEKNAIEKALQQELIDTGNYPSSIDGVQRKICSSTVTTDCIDITTDLAPNYMAAIPTGGTYTVARGNDGRVYVNTSTTAANLTCPTGYIPVPGNSLYQTKDFCVMKYEAKAVATSAPTVGLTTPTTGFNTIANNTTATTAANGRTIASVASGYPIANIDQPTAASYCTTAGASLITNAEWMTIARNIEAQPSNWRNGVIGSVDTSPTNGGLYRGHSDNNPANALAANTDDNLGYEGTGNANETPVSRERRTHTLSNGEVIWDLSGNVWEWTNNTILGKDQPTGSSTGWIWREYNTGQSNSITNFGTLSRDLIGPSNSNWGSTQNMGQIYSDGTSTSNTSYAFLRGGFWNFSSNAGVFTLGLHFGASSVAGNYIGFRCVLR
jgi:prepilin-type N-terminal cleavage/methylation domain-containing protein